MSSTDGANVSAEAMERELNAKTRQLESLAIQQKKKEVIFSISCVCDFTYYHI